MKGVPFRAISEHQVRRMSSQPALQIIKYLSSDELEVFIQIAVDQLHSKMENSPAHWPTSEDRR